MSTLRSPNEMFEAAKEVMLEGRSPSTTKDWMLVVNFQAANIAKGLEEKWCLLFKTLYDCPLHDDLIREIAAFQAERK